MDEQSATWIAEAWRGNGRLVPRGPRWLLGYTPADPRDVERHTGRRPPATQQVWRVDVGGRFLRSGGTVYPGGVPYPEELAGRTATISSEVWLYVDDADSRVLGLHSWPEAVRRPVASSPIADYDESDAFHPDDAPPELDFELPLPTHPGWSPGVVVCQSRDEAIVLLVKATMPDPLNEMMLYEEDGLSLRVSRGEPPDFAAVLRVHQPPYRHSRLRGLQAIGREPGRALGPQTWPWPAELLWSKDGLCFELRGFVSLEVLEEVARTLP